MVGIKRILALMIVSALGWWMFLKGLSEAQGSKSDADSPLPREDFEAASQGWQYVGGQEFPGARGSMKRDTTEAHRGKGSLRLQADFTKGGAYVGIWKNLPDLKSLDLKEIRLWVKRQAVGHIGIRIVDDTGRTANPFSLAG